MKNAGFEITDIKQTYIGKDYTEGYVFGTKRNKYMPSGMEYVTWAYTKRNGEYDFYWGHYFAKEEPAWEDYCKRAGIINREYEQLVIKEG